MLSLERLPLADILEAELLKSPEAIWLERNRIESLLGEQKLRALLAPEQGAERVSVGRLLKAQMLVILHTTTDVKIPRVELVVCETQHGLRLLTRTLPLSADARADAAALVRFADQGIRHIREPIREIYAVPPLFSKDLAYQYDYLRTAYARLIEQMLLEQPGTLVVEMAEADAIAREVSLAGETPSRRLPLYISGEYEHLGTDGTMVAIALRLRRGQKQLAEMKETVAAGQEHDFLCRALAKFAAQRGLDVPVGGKSDAAEELRQLLQLAEEHRQQGNWKESLALTEAALLLDPRAKQLHCDAIAEITALINAGPYNLGSISVWVASAQLYRRGLQHLDAAISNGLDLTQFQWFAWKENNFVERFLRLAQRPIHCGLPREARESMLQVREDNRETLQRLARQFATRQQFVLAARLWDYAASPLDRQRQYEEKLKFVRELQTAERPEYWLPLVGTGCSRQMYDDDTAEGRWFLDQLIGLPQLNARVRQVATQLRRSLDWQRTHQRDPFHRIVPESRPKFTPSTDFALRLVNAVWKLRCQPAGDGIDVFWEERQPGHVYVMKEKGILKPVGPQVDYCADMIFDGRYVWLATQALNDAPRVLAIDPSVERYWELTEKNGLSLPKVHTIPRGSTYTYNVRLAPVAPGKVCIAAGYGRAWIAMVTLDPGGDHKVNVFHRATEPQLRDDRNQWKRTTVAFLPAHMATLEESGKDGIHKKVLIDRGYRIGLHNADLICHPLIVDTETLSVDVVRHDLPLPEDVEVHNGALYWVSALPPSYRQLAVNRAALPDLIPKPVMPLERGGVLLFTGEQMHVVGRQWWTGRLGDTGLKCLADVPWYCFGHGIAERFDQSQVYKADYRPLDQIARSNHYGIIVNHRGPHEPSFQVLLGEEARRANAAGTAWSSPASPEQKPGEDVAGEDRNQYAQTVTAIFVQRPQIVEDARDFAPGPVRSMVARAVIAASGDHRYLAVGMGKVILLCSAETKEIVRVLQGHLGAIERLAFTPDSARLISCGEYLRMWDVASGKQVLQMPTVHADIGGMLFSPDGKWLIVGDPGQVSVWDLQTLKCAYHTRVIRHLGGFLPDGTLLANADDSAEGIIAWDVARGTSRQILSYSLGWPLAVSRDGKRLATAEDRRAQGDELVYSNRVLVWDLARQRVLLAIDGAPRQGAASYKFSPDGAKLLALDFHGRTFSWDISENVNLQP